MLKIIDNGIISHQKERGAYMPVITPLTDGSFIACQHVGEGLGTPDNHIEDPPFNRRRCNVGSTKGVSIPEGNPRTDGLTGVRRLARCRTAAW